ncbi:MAG TPA: hemolysin family protein [Chloroflexota bacterium]|nr:hemolysin family protein [Chloroflexota bacterium]
MNAQFWELVLLVLAFLLAGMSAAAETAFTALTPATIHTLEERGGVGRVIAYLRHDPNRFLSTILVVSSSSLIVASSMATLLLTSWLPRPWGEIAATVGISILVLIFAELTPKNFAVRRSTRVALVLARPVRFFSIVFQPIITVTGWIVGVLMRIAGLGGGNTSVVPTITEDDVRATIDVSERSEGGLTEEEAERIEGILDLDKVVVDQVMRPRVDIVAVPADMPVMEALDVILREGHSRIPVYDESIDNIIGILYDKDLLKYVRENATDVSLRDIAREAIFVPESKRADDLLREFQRRKVHLAIVFDEYGGTAGLVTIEDILEEIVGEIQDEYDQEPPPFEKKSEDEWIFDAMVRIEEVNEEMGLDLEAENGIETLGGFVYERLGEAPEVGDVVEADHVHLEVVDIEGRRIKKVRITRVPNQEPELAVEEER